MSPSNQSLWRKLPRYTQQQVALHQTAITYFSTRLAAPDFGARLAAHIGQALRAEAILSSPKLRMLERAELLAQLPEVGFFAVLSAAPTPHKIAVDVDAALGSWAVERLLAGEAAQTGAHMARPPTDLELGVLTYLLLDVLDLCTGELEGGRELALSLERMVGSGHALAEALQSDDDVLEVGLRLQLEHRLGYVRVLLPASLITGFFGAHVADQSERPEELRLVRRCIAALPHQAVDIRAVAARLTLSADDIASVEVGDIIVLEGHELTTGADGIVGAVSLKVGRGQNGTIKATVRHEGAEALFEITDIVVQHEAQGAAMAEGAQGEPDNLPQTEGLLRDVESPVAVELGRLRLNTAQIVRLRAGQVLRLARNATDPVDLVVNGKLFARGELIEVDGELGVRLTHVTGTKA